MSQQPIRNKVNQLASAPTPQNTPASVTGSYLKSNPIVPSTIDEESEIKKNLSNNPAFLSMIQGKLGTLVGKDSGYIDSLSKDVKNRIYSLKSVQSDQMKLEEEFQKELLELEKKFYKKYEPLYQKRSDIINGELEPSLKEIEAGKKIESELEGDEDIEEEDNEEDEEQEDDVDQEDIKGIPHFWLTALENLHPVSDTITERDSEVLSFLKNIKLEYLDQPGFKLIFEFNENEFFHNKNLTKTYYYQEELGYSGDFIYDHAEGDEIKWKSQESNVTISIERRKQRNKHTKQTRTIEKLTPTESFFNFFDPPKTPDDEQNEQNDEDDEEDEEQDQDDLEERLALDYQLGEEIKDKLIPRAVDWFTGSAIDYGLEDEEFDDEEDFDEEDEEDDSEGDDDDDEDSEEEGADGQASKGKQQPPECKQS
ncbi:Nucleosome assembly protein 1-like 4 [Wickerhamomyces ciferrii]|uniref:Nucleosome assembly protein 1-like 4 n=1 Tax=Wickerhamomyces ciferrii (strain ATCC 14091 / BCRC 22168 / CBS 111 / JCM 3599 / NBRC 0793 / NRRL Y-1031 F-60-10) TaxID=1206466 RepID=K0KNM2_WICCF|nr:Nucleosome assembly protein 1-like 4 [Wickerhamomyces ciferrii]CCH46855.1 Nucleosome assembly protein 1-like 4 [Wickerhamomyces ciferrii]